MKWKKVTFVYASALRRYETILFFCFNWSFKMT